MYHQIYNFNSWQPWTAIEPGGCFQGLGPLIQFSYPTYGPGGGNNKDPVKFRFIAGNVKVLTSKLDDIVARILKMVKGHFINL